MRIRNVFTVQKNDETPLTCHNTLLASAFMKAFSYESGGGRIELYEDGTPPDVFEDKREYVSYANASTFLSNLSYDKSLKCFKTTTTVVFALSAAVGKTIRSVGVTNGKRSYTSGVYGFSRALLTDQNGNPVEILKTDLDTITVTYTLYVHMDISNHEYLIGIAPMFASDTLLSGMTGSCIKSSTKTSEPGETPWAEIAATYRLPDTYGNEIDIRYMHCARIFTKRFDMLDTGYRLENQPLYKLDNDRCYQARYYGCYDEVVKINGNVVPKTAYDIYPDVYTPYYISRSHYIYKDEPCMPIGPHVYLCDYISSLTRYFLEEPIDHVCTVNSTATTNSSCYSFRLGGATGDEFILRNDTNHKIDYISMGADKDCTVSVYGSIDGATYTPIRTDCSISRSSGHTLVNMNRVMIPVEDTYKYIKYVYKGESTFYTKLFTKLPNVDGAAGTIIFNEAPLDSDVITIDYTTRSMPKGENNVIDYTFTARVE